MTGDRALFEAEYLVLMKGSVECEVERYLIDMVDVDRYKYSGPTEVKQLFIDRAMDILGSENLEGWNTDAT